MNKFKKDDEVIIIKGKDKGKKSKIIQSFPKLNKVICENINMVSKHIKQTDKVKGGIIQVPAKIAVSNIMLLDDKGNVAKVKFNKDKTNKREIIKR